MKPSGFLKHCLFVVGSLLAFTVAQACTSFGMITDTGTLLGKNRDYFYTSQSFGLNKPVSRFDQWYGNPYHHANQFYAISYLEGIALGVNQQGLTAIEEDFIGLGHAKNAEDYKKQQQQSSGLPDGLVMYGVLQNFNTIDEMMPYLTPIFKNAAPDFYQFADAKKILTVEVTPGGAFSYQVLSKPKQYFVHTNTYVSPEFVALNQAITNTSRLESSNNRFVTMSQLIAHAPVWNLAAASQWILDTTSTQVNADNSCLNTSLFRSYLQGFNAINMNTPNDRVFGTVSTVIVNNTGDLKTSQILVRMFDAITTRSDGSQLITYRELDTTLAQLFSSDAPPPFVTHDFVRAAPVNGVCS